MFFFHLYDSFVRPPHPHGLPKPESKPAREQINVDSILFQQLQFYWENSREESKCLVQYREKRERQEIKLKHTGGKKNPFTFGPVSLASAGYISPEKHSQSTMLVQKPFCVGVCAVSRDYCSLFFVAVSCQIWWEASYVWQRSWAQFIAGHWFVSALQARGVQYPNCNKQGVFRLERAKPDTLIVL